jgi:hypothetical protein
MVVLRFLEVEFEFGQIDGYGYGLQDIRSQDLSQGGSRNAIASCYRPQGRRRWSIALPLWQ